MSYRKGLFTALLWSIATVALAQQPEPDAPGAVFHSDSRLVQLHVTVTDAEGHLIPGLPQSSFQVLENGVAQEIKVFRQEDAPVSLGLVIDNSASMKDKRARVAAAVLTLIGASNEGDEEFIVNFNEKPVLAREFTKDLNQLKATLSKIDSNGSTAMRDALSLGLEHAGRLGKNDKKVLIVVTDGEDNSSVETLARVSREAQQSGVLIYAIGLLSDDDEREAARAKRDLDTVALATGGEAFYPRDLSQVDEIARHVAHDLRNQYTIAYSPENQKADGSFRKINVTLSGPAGAVVRTRTGYYATGSATPPPES